MTISRDPVQRVSVANYSDAADFIYNQVKSEFHFIGFRVMSATRIPLGCDNFSKFLPPCCLSRFASGGLGLHPMCVWKEHQSFSFKVVYPEMLNIHLRTIQ